MNITRNKPSKKSQIILAALKQAVANAMERKRKLGQYVVVFENNKLVFKGEDAPIKEYKIKPEDPHEL